MRMSPVTTAFIIMSVIFGLVESKSSSTSAPRFTAPIAEDRESPNLPPPDFRIYDAEDKGVQTYFFPTTGEPDKKEQDEEENIISATEAPELVTVQEALTEAVSVAEVDNSPAVQELPVPVAIEEPLVETGPDREALMKENQMYKEVMTRMMELKRNQTLMMARMNPYGMAGMPGMAPAQQSAFMPMMPTNPVMPVYPQMQTNPMQTMQMQLMANQFAAQQAQLQQMRLAMQSMQQRQAYGMSSQAMAMPGVSQQSAYSPMIANQGQMMNNPMLMQQMMMRNKLLQQQQQQRQMQQMQQMQQHAHGHANRNAIQSMPQSQMTAASVKKTPLPVEVVTAKPIVKALPAVSDTLQSMPTPEEQELERDEESLDSKASGARVAEQTDSKQVLGLDERPNFKNAKPDSAALDYESQAFSDKLREVGTPSQTLPSASLEDSEFLEQILRGMNATTSPHKPKRQRRPHFLVKASIRKLSKEKMQKASWLKDPPPDYCTQSILVHDECDKARNKERRWSFNFDDGTCYLYEDPCPADKKNSFTALSACIAACWRQTDRR